MTVVSQRAGLVMNPDAKVKLARRAGGQGRLDRVAAERPSGSSLAMYPSELQFIPANVLVDIASSTVFGAKSVELVHPPSPRRSGSMPARRWQAKHVMVEINTVFQQLVSVLDQIDPPKLNESLGALAKAFSGRGPQLGQSLSDLDSFLAKLEPSLPALSHDLAVLPAVSNAYADAAPDLLRTVANTNRISKTIVDEQHNLDALLISAIGLADIGNDVLSTNRQALTNVLHLLVPTTDLTNEYNEALTCGLAGLIRITHGPPLSEPSINITASLTWGAERYRYPANLPKVAATGGPRCLGLPQLPFNTPSAATDYRYRCQPGGVWKPAAADQLRSPQTAVVRADCRAHRATPLRSDNPDENARHADQVRDLRGRDGDADRLPVLHLRPVPDRFDDRVFGGVQRCVASQSRGRRCGSPGSGWAPSAVFRCGRTKRLW